MVLSHGEPVRNAASLRFVLRSCLPGATGAEIEKLGGLLAGRPEALTSPEVVAHALRQHLASERTRRPNDLRLLRLEEELATQMRWSLENATAYVGEGRTNPDAVFYPNPAEGPRFRSTHRELPWAKLHSSIDAGTPVISAGSCFATEIAAHLQSEGFNYVVTEPYHHNGSRWAHASAAWGTIFNVPGFRQLVEKAFRLRTLPKLLWRIQKNGRTIYRDPFREEIEFASVAEYEAGYERHLDACRDALLEAEVFVLTLGLTEVWKLAADGSALSRVPWRLAPSLVRHEVLTVEQNLAELELMARTLRVFNPRVRFIVTVSPVPLQATFRGHTHHAITATVHSKSVLRVVAEEFVARTEGAEYFPAYEVVTQCRERPFLLDQRHVTRATVNEVMHLFRKVFVRHEGVQAVQIERKLSAAGQETRLLLLPDWDRDPGPVLTRIAELASAFPPDGPTGFVIWLPEDVETTPAQGQDLLLSAFEKLALDPDAGAPMLLLTAGRRADPGDALEGITAIVRAVSSEDPAALAWARRVDCPVLCGATARVVAAVAAFRECSEVLSAVRRLEGDERIAETTRRALAPFREGYRRWLETEETPRSGYLAMRQLALEPRPRVLPELREALARAHPPRPVPGSGATVFDGSLSEAERTEALADLRRDGLHVFPRLMSPRLVDELVAYGETAPVDTCFSDRRLGPAMPVGQHPEEAPGYRIPEAELVRSRSVRKFLFEPDFLRIAQEYLGLDPIFDLAAMWWSFPTGTSPRSDLSQLFHYDINRMHFLKFFVYLTDVGEDGGPHEYVRGTHRLRPPELALDGRLDTESVRAHFAESGRITRLSGARGTVFVADTLALHRGTVPAARPRLMLQSEFASSGFGAPFPRYNRLDLDLGAEEAASVDQRPRTWQRFYGPRE